jgi:hypothetical protein
LPSSSIPIQTYNQQINTNMTLWSMASRRARLLRATPSSSLPAVSLGGTRQFSVAEKDNILPVSFAALLFCCLLGGGGDIFI